MAAGDEHQAYTGPPLALSARRRGLGRGQATVWLILGIGVAAAIAHDRDAALLTLVLIGQGIFLGVASWRIATVMISSAPVVAVPELSVWPRYTILAAMHDEADVIGQLIERLAEIDYPAERLEAFLLLEGDDAATIEAAMVVSKPDWMSIVVVPEGEPRTKPRALNHGLGLATGDLVTIYDAEDDPDPLQLREAAARFAASAAGRLACLQAPLRIRHPLLPAHGSPFLDRQFAVEYAALFEVTLPAMARMGLPFPLGGTSNHFRAEALREVGGWDPWNVTEDADLGFRLWRAGWRQGVITRPTYETPPGPLRIWLPQRTRWLKGFMQTWGVHTRRPLELGWRGFWALLITTGATLAAAGLHALALAWVFACLMVAGVSGLAPDTPLFALGVLITGTAAAWLQGAIGARRGRVEYGPIEMLGSPLYWSLQTLAFVHAAWRLVREPFIWDKTQHRRDGARLADYDEEMQPVIASGEPIQAAPAGREAA
ncbi:glycosyltransferase [soil metagenome]